MNESDIEDDIPLGPPAARPYAYPALYTMGIGQSFARPIEERAKLHGASQFAARKTTRAFSLRQMGDIVRIWRIQ